MENVDFLVLACYNTENAGYAVKNGKYTAKMQENI